MSAPAPPVFFAVLPAPGSRNAAGSGGGVFSPFRCPPAPLDFSAPTRAGRGGFRQANGEGARPPLQFYCLPITSAAAAVRGPKKRRGNKKTACGCFLLLRHKKRLISMAVARRRATWPKKQPLCGCFLLLRNKKQLISMAVARGRATWPKKQPLCGCFLLLRNKKQFISMAVARGRATGPKK